MRSFYQAERRNGDLVRSLIHDGAVTAVHDVSDGGVLVALAEMAIAGGIGAELEPAPQAAHAFWFGEDQARYLVTVPMREADRVSEHIRAAGISVRPLGMTGGDALTVKPEGPILVGRLREAFEGWFPVCMSGGV